MNRLYVSALILALLVACPPAPALEAQGLSEKDAAAAMKMLGEACKKLEAAQRAREKDLANAARMSAEAAKKVESARCAGERDLANAMKMPGESAKKLKAAQSAGEKDTSNAMKMLAEAVKKLEDARSVELDTASLAEAEQAEKAAQAEAAAKVAEAAEQAAKPAKADTALVGTWLLAESSLFQLGTPTVLEFRKDGTGALGGTDIKWSAEDGRLLVINTSSADKRDTFSCRISDSTLILANDKGQSLKYIKETGFIAIAPDEMTWSDAEAYCASKGARLPLIGGSKSLTKVPKGAPIDGFGAEGARWPPSATGSDYWTGTENSYSPGCPWYLYSGSLTLDVSVNSFPRLDSKKRVACVPSNDNENEAERKAEAERSKAEAERKAAGFIAFAPNEMNWSDAKAYCASKGGQLPLIGGSDSLTSAPNGAPVDGFGSVQAKWPSILPHGDYWTGTEGRSGGGNSVYVSFDHNDKNYAGWVEVVYGPQGRAHRVVCVPSTDGGQRAAAKAATEELARKAEIAKAEAAIKAEAKRKAAGFIALAPEPLNWNDADAYCKSKGGRLPLVNGKTSLRSSKGATIDGFGSEGAEWPSGLPYVEYWTGTELSGSPDKAWFVGSHARTVVLGSQVRSLRSTRNRVVCVP